MTDSPHQGCIVWNPKLGRFEHDQRKCAAKKDSTVEEARADQSSWLRRMRDNRGS
ncbi:MAG: hypothetical protein AB7J35_21250 [Dehalococcoidia bacterium]